ncbi:MAG: nucleotide sugar dehydrogenase [Desulfovibrio sp.]|uniref:nucleotide sugar dehydrogenase n=1 Tax=Desulfovibrio sp. 7SRBS1 TaxID=3378064 RepID=UPI003B3C36B5
MKLSVIGLGKLGLCTACCLARAGYEVVGMDIRDAYVEGLRQGQIPFHEAGLDVLLAEVKGNLHLTTDMAEAVERTDAALIIVPTPSTEDGSFSNEYLVRVFEGLAPALKAKDSFFVVDVVSTVMPLSSDKELIPLLEELSGKQMGKDIGYAYNPEFIAIGSVIQNFLYPDLVLIGESDSRTGSLMQEVYEKTCDNTPVICRTSVVNAEIAKLSINCYCTMKISFANNLSLLCENIPGADAHEIAALIGNDTRIGTKYIRPGLGFGGPCFPRDNEAFIRCAELAGTKAPIQESVVAVNNSMVDVFVERIHKAVSAPDGVVALLGLSYKPETYLTERSQSLDIARELTRRYPRLTVRVHDPMAKENGPWEQTETVAQCVEGAHVAAILTPWKEYMEVSWAQGMAAGSVVVNCWT